MSNSITPAAVSLLQGGESAPIGEYGVVGWVPPANLTFEQWEAVGKRLQQVGRGLNFWLGDWLATGEFRWGESYAQALDLGIALESLEKYKAVATRVPLPLRRTGLSWSHHFAVAYIDEDQRAPLLALAERFDLRTREFKEVCSLKREKRAELLEALADLPESGVFVDFARLLNAVRLGNHSGEPVTINGHAEHDDEIPFDDPPFLHIEQEEVDDEADSDSVFTFWDHLGVPLLNQSNDTALWQGISVRAVLVNGRPVLSWEIVP